ncbi:MAG: sugar transferase [Blastocatellia bacterium]
MVSSFRTSALKLSACRRVIPRPPIPYEVECYEAWHRKRLGVKPGLTGVWQVSGRYHLSFKQMGQLDIYYIENWSLWLDLKITLKTLPALFMREQTGKG